MLPRTCECGLVLMLPPFQRRISGRGQKPGALHKHHHLQVTTGPTSHLPPNSETSESIFALVSSESGQCAVLVCKVLRKRCCCARVPRNTLARRSVGRCFLELRKSRAKPVGLRFLRLRERTKAVGPSVLKTKKTHESGRSVFLKTRPVPVNVYLLSGQ